ncbi:ABC transporter permease [Sedimenticola selenatireducens]|uniref:ABC transporter permease n=1 Tax=Sedimenticola selenatireducens TaxID=191960 RepID=A0A558DK26_9GAMM|nr:ABC transporter permease [Sedimenticola selenatireducens]TVO76259.1 ABC transporter permease [Sedimenticola selenatireducens]TVT61369.1 MAG: ABC transporter permease [Sedimenticola selenatireducens]
MIGEWVILWTDALIFLLLLFSTAFGIYAARKEHLRGPWRLVVRSRVGVSTLVILSFYVIVGLLDSVHFYPLVNSVEKGGAQTQSAEVISLFDHLVTPLRERQEKTYSAPLATHLYAKENIELPNGEVIRDYPRLEFGGAHLTMPEVEWSEDILRLSAMGVIKGLLVSIVITNILIMLLAARWNGTYGDAAKLLITGKTVIPWRTALITLMFVILILFWSIELSSHYHILGTDKVGEDVFYQALKSIRTGLLIGTLTTLVMLPAAILLGIMAGYYRGWVDDLIQYVYTTLNSIPGVLLIAAAILMLQIYMSNHADEFNSLVERADLRLLFLCIILGVTSWTGLCRLLRGEAMKLREVDYVQAAVAFGVGHFQIIVRHILPNVLHIVLITVVLDFSGLVLAEAVLSYVNIGVDPTMNSWGNMINSARLEMAREPVVWWSLLASMIFMFVLVLSANLFSDVVRDAFDPRLRSSR